MFCVDLVLFVHLHVVAQKTTYDIPQVFSFLQQTVIGKNSFCYLWQVSPVTKESLFCDEREPLWRKRGKSDFFRSKNFAMSLFRAIFASGNGQEVATLFSVFPMCLRSAFALPSLWVRPKSGYGVSPLLTHSVVTMHR